MSATATRSVNGPPAPASGPVASVSPVEVSPRDAFGTSCEDAALALGRPVSPGLTPASAEASFADRARSIAHYRAVFGSADPSWSTRCDDGQDRAPMVMLAYLIGCKADSKARASTIKRLSDRAKARLAD